MAALRRIKAAPRREDVADEADVPAAVVCAICGDAECPGCDAELTRSGVLAVVPWERPQAHQVSRLWLTARATTLDAERFFEALPDGPLAPAFRFAVACELLAASALGLCAVPFGVLVAPGWVRQVVMDGAARGTALRVILAALLSVSAILVIAHAVHALALDVGARRNGGRVVRGGRRRALRFGLYAAGWDLVLGPLGFVVLVATEGAGRALSILVDGTGLPTRSAAAFARGAYHLDGPRAKRALRWATFGAAVATLVGASLVLAGLLALIF